MSVIYNATVRTARMNEVLTAIGNAGKVKIYVSGGATLLATFTLPTPSGTVSGDVLTLDCDPDIEATAGNTGDAAEATITDSADTVVVSGLTVATSGGDVTISPAIGITSGQTVRLTALSITHPSA